MKVILLQNIKGFGQIGDVKNVSDGHARNYLFPRKLAKLASAGALKEAEAFQKKRDFISTKDQENVQKASLALADATIEFKKKASKAGTLFSSLNKEEIAEELTKYAGVNITEDMLDLGDLGEHIKHLGDHIINVKFNKDTRIQIKVLITTPN